jgi:hypothetical protein
MRKTAAVLFFALVSFLAASQLSSQAQVTAQTKSSDNPAPKRLPVEAQIGNSVVALNGPWAFHPGDDMAWAQPDFDDSQWASMDLTPPPGSYDPVLGTSGYVPGWTARGYQHLAHFAWYRLRVDVRNTAETARAGRLALRMPDNLDDAYQVYVNGQYIGEFGRFTESGVTFYGAQPEEFALPGDVRNGPITIAVRMWMDLGTPLMSPDAGGLHGPPVLGTADSVDAAVRLDWDDIGKGVAFNVFRIPLIMAVFLLGATLYYMDRRESAYLWMALAALTHLASGFVGLTSTYSTVVSMVISNFVGDAVTGPLSIGAWTIFWGYWFGFANMRRVHVVAWSLVALTIVSFGAQHPPFYGTIVPAGASVWLVPATECSRALLVLFIFWISYQGIRRGGMDGWLALIPLLLTPIWLFSDDLALLHVRTIFHFFSLIISVGQVATALMLVAVSVLLMRRFIRGMGEKKQMEMEVEQARQVQQVLIPEALPHIAGFEIESEYRPAEQVGGDFFQIVPLAGGSVLLVIGDVSGKGMPAAMTVSLLVGTVRTLARFTRSPQSILEEMNVRMLGRGRGGFTTCLIARVDSNGKVTMANAGHLAPYCEGNEVAVLSGLPLGLNRDSTYPETEFRLGTGEQLTLLTDGVAEARDAEGKLFGFEGAAEISTLGAIKIAEAAQRFGQQDDITVLTLKRVATRVEPATELAAAHA